MKRFFRNFILSLFVIVLTVMGSLSVFAADISKAQISSNAAKLSVFQEQIKNCAINVPFLEKLKTMTALYKAVDQKFKLSSEKILIREILYKVKNEKRKLKIENDEIKIFEIDDQDIATLLSGDMRQKMKTIAGQVKQLTLNASISSDWSKTQESREGGLDLEITRIDGKITQLRAIWAHTPQVLECQTSGASQFCLCYSAAKKPS